LLAAFILPVSLISMLQVGFVQAYVAQRFANKLSKDLHTEVSIGNVNITFLLNFIFEDVKVKDLHHNTLLDSKALIVDLNDLFIYRNVISINHIVLDNTSINLIQYKGEKKMNYQFIVDYFSSGDTIKTKGGKSWKIWVASLKLIDSRFKYQDQNQEPQKTGIDFDDLDITGINAKINNITLAGDSIFADISKLSMKDRSGFDLKNLSASAKITSTGIDLKKLNIETPGTSLNLNLAFDFKSYDDFSSFIDKVKINALFKPSKIDFKDICYFAPDITGMDNVINVSGEVTGKISDLRAKNFQLLYGRSTSFLGNFNITGLPDIESTYMHFNIKNIYTCQSDLRSFDLPNSAGDKHLELPAEVIKFGNVRFEGNFTGFYNDFVASGDFYTDMGKISTDLTLRKNRSNNQLEYDGNIATTNLNLGNILSMQDDIGFITLNANVSGSGFDPQNAVVSMKGTIAAIDYKKYRYKNIEIKGDLAKERFNGYLRIDDENIKLDLTGMVDYSKSLPVFNVESKIENLRLTKLHFLDLSGDSLSSISSELKLNFQGNTIDNIQGTITAQNTSYIYKGEKYFLSNFIFTNTAEDNGNKTLKLKSDYIEADISGNFMFKYLYRSFQKFVEDYLPSYTSWVKKKVDSSIPEQNFIYSVRLKNTLPLSKLFMPELTISQNTVINGSYNTKKSLLDFNVTSALAKYNNYRFKDFFLKCKTKNSKIIINIGCEQAAISDSLGLDNFTLKCVTKNDSINYKMSWKNNNDKVKNSGSIAGFLTFFKRPKIELKFNDAKLVINDTTWTVDKNNDIFIDSSSIAVNNLLFSSGSQQLKIFGNISVNPADIMHVSFKDFNISDADALNSITGFDLDGYLNGTIDLSNVYKSLNVVSDLTIRDLYINKEKLGKAVFITDWDDQRKTASINADIIYEGNAGSNTPISLTGNYYPDRKNENFDLNINLSNFKLKLLEKYISDFSSNLRGYASGNLKLTGTLGEPDLHGQLFLMVKGFRIDYLNEEYSFTDTVDVDKNAFRFNHLTLNDEKGNTAILNGKITHENFKDIKFDFSIRPNKLECLNTNSSQNSIFYGKAYATGLIKITGDPDNIIMDISAKTEKNTHIFIPITSESDISEGDFIKFINNKSVIIKNDDYSTDLSGMQMNFNLEVTPDADMQIIFDSKIGDIIKAKGSGNIKMVVTPNGDFNMYGNYVIENGDYLFTLKNVINKKFIIQKGSSLSWNGSPYNGTADITAIYSVKAPLLDLVPGASSEDSSKYKKRIDVNCLLNMKDKIFNPTLTFNIDLPNSGEDEKNLVKSNTSTEQDMNMQIFSLLIINRFTTPKNNLPSLNGGLGANSSELLSNQLSNWLSQISKKVDIGVNYRPGNELTREELEVALSTQLFNDKLSIDGNVQTGNNQTGKTSSIVGDVNVEYKLTNDGHFMVKGFNKSNSVDLLNNDALNTQGIGIFYRREFDSFGDLFRRKKKDTAN